MISQSCGKILNGLGRQMCTLNEEEKKKVFQKENIVPKNKHESGEIIFFRAFYY